jgi:hypothetical protein
VPDADSMRSLYNWIEINNHGRAIEWSHDENYDACIVKKWPSQHSRWFDTLELTWSLLLRTSFQLTNLI